MFRNYFGKSFRYNIIQLIIIVTIIMLRVYSIYAAGEGRRISVGMSFT